MYRGRLWTMRQFAGFGTRAQTNARFRYLLSRADRPLHRVRPAHPDGRDSDDPMAPGRGGREGVAIDSLADMETLSRGSRSTGLRLHDDQRARRVIFAMYLAVAEKQGVPFAKLEGTLQNDILKEYIAQKEWIFPPRPACASSPT
jgi:methylmalonyl-CoA mutase N-terminal domain/subunit